MSEVDHGRLTELVGAALREPSDRRAAWLEDACGDDHALRAEIESLLGEEESLEGFLERPAAIEVAGRLAKSSRSSLPNAIGPYRVLRLLGRGGMGTVYLAEQEQPVERLVALKVLDRVGGREGPRSRFVAECRALARLKHSNVAAIYDAGISADGRAFVAMEWVEG
ncbi:MAG: protein kinase, partial [Acidobacteriota bacterium]